MKTTNVERIKVYAVVLICCPINTDVFLWNSYLEGQIEVLLKMASLDNFITLADNFWY